jgi:hypothetical protein
MVVSPGRKSVAKDSYSRSRGGEDAPNWIICASAPACPVRLLDAPIRQRPAHGSAPGGCSRSVTPSTAAALGAVSWVKGEGAWRG